MLVPMGPRGRHRLPPLAMPGRLAVDPAIGSRRMSHRKLRRLMGRLRRRRPPAGATHGVDPARMSQLARRRPRQCGMRGWHRPGRSLRLLPLGFENVAAPSCAPRFGPAQTVVPLPRGKIAPHQGPRDAGLNGRYVGTA